MPQVSRKKQNKSISAADKAVAAVLILAIAVLSALLAHFISAKRNEPPEPVEFDKLQIEFNRTPLPRQKSDIKYIVIHDTDNTAKTATALNHYTYFNTGNRKSSADFFIDDTQILQVNDYYSYYTWHCGDGGSDADIRNINSIGVEICVNKGGDYSKAVNSAVALTKNLMYELDVDIDHVVRHRDASGKNCPRSMSEKDWENFKRQLVSKNFKSEQALHLASKAELAPI